MLAQRFATRHGSRLTGLVLAGPITELAPAGKEAFSKRIETVRREGMFGVADAVLGGALTAATREANPALAGLLREVILANDPECYIGHCRALMAASAKEDQPKIPCRTLVLVGDQDPVTPLASARQVVGAIQGSRLRVIPATAHMTMLECPDAFNAALIEFIAEL